MKHIGNGRRILTLVIAFFLTIVIIPTVLNPATASSGGVAYIGSDIKWSSSNAWMLSYPDKGSFSMSGITYFKGITNESSSRDGTARFNITNMGFTRLTGTFGRVSGEGVRNLIIIGDGKLLAGYELAQNGIPIKIDVSLSQGIKQIDIRIQHLGGIASGIFALADAFFSNSTQTPLPVPTHPYAVENASYLESDIIWSSNNAWMLSYPNDGSFTISDTTYYRGVANESSSRDGTARYNITNMGFTRLTGIFGRVSGEGVRNLIITGDGKLLAGYELKKGVSQMKIDVNIPIGIKQIDIRIQHIDIGGTASGIFALADAYFSNSVQMPLPVPTHPYAVDSASYLESDIKWSSSNAWMLSYPNDGSYSISGTTYFRGVANESSSRDGTARYNITNMGFVLLRGVFGRVNGSGVRNLIITGDGTLLKSYELKADGAPLQVEVKIPESVKQIDIMIQHIDIGGKASGIFAFADAYFSDGSQSLTPPPPTSTPEPTTPPISSTIPNPHSEWATEELEIAAEMGLIPESLQDPSIDYSKPISRVEFAGVVVKTYEIIANTTALPAVNNPFKDTTSIDVLKAYNSGLMTGVSANAFDPNTLLTREMAATALTRVFKRSTMPGWSFTTDASFQLTFTWPPLFNDDANISSWARESVYFMAANGIIKGFEGNVFGPRNVTTEQEAKGYATTTREQALIIAKRMVESHT